MTNITEAKEKHFIIIIFLKKGQATNFQHRYQKHTIEKEKPLQKIVFRKWESHM